jgi:hypothetical protein
MDHIFSVATRVRPLRFEELLTNRDLRRMKGTILVQQHSEDETKQISYSDAYSFFADRFDLNSEEDIQDIKDTLRREGIMFYVVHML